MTKDHDHATTTQDHDHGTDLVELGVTDGVAFVGQDGALTRLHYFDGQYLRAAALTLEQDYHRHVARLGNLAGGWGVVHGFGVGRTGDRLDVGAGLAVTPAGSFVLAESDLKASLADLLKVAAAPPPPGKSSFDRCREPAGPGVKATPSLAIYEITVGPIEGLCGNEPVYGKLCETACASDSRRPWWVEGVVLRLRPVSLSLPDSKSTKPAVAHLRNRIASAYFASEPWLQPSLLSAAGLASNVWCEPAVLYGRDEVVIGLLAREGTVVRVIDAWSGRRERMDAQARGYWQGRMSMRPWNVFLAQILQFQCQLSGLFDPGSKVILPGDDCDRLRDVLGRTRREIDALLKRYGDSTKKILLRTESRPTLVEHHAVASEVSASFADLVGLSSALAEAASGRDALPVQGMLLHAGFFELPPAGYLPVAPDTDVHEQVTRMFGDGVRVHFHSVRSDETGHLVEEAQHLERISLTRGLDDPSKVERVEVFVPDGEVGDAQATSPGTWWRMGMSSITSLSLIALATRTRSEQAVERTAAEERPGARDDPARGVPAPAGDRVGGLQDAQLSPLVTWMRSTALEGLARTESRRDGTFGLTLVVANDPLQGGVEAGREPDGNPPPDRDAPAPGAEKAAARGRLGLYFSADVDKDPFDLPVGGDTGFEAEVRTMFGGSTQESEVSGKLTVLHRKTLASGVEERLVQVDRVDSEGAGGGTVASPRSRSRIVLQRDGDAKDGIFVIDDEDKDPKSSPIHVEWDSVPRHAVVYLEGEDAARALVGRMQKLSSGTSPLERAAEGAAAGVVRLGEAARRAEMLAMDELPSMPLPTSHLGAAAMNTLSAMADATDDTGFLMRARRRLFPVLDAPKRQVVRAVHDWVMFRRARTALCGPPCAAGTPPLVEAYQVWHLRLKTAEREFVAKLAHALEVGEANFLNELDVRRVGVLRYRDESAYSEEPADRVVSMWSDAHPGKDVVMGRAWESAPTTGHGWQNHMRLRHMVEQIAALTRPPARGGGELLVIPPPPGRLADGSLDGGLLVVTTDEPGPVVEATSRRALLAYGKRAGDMHSITDAPRSETKFVTNVPQGASLREYVTGLQRQPPPIGVTLVGTRAGEPPDAGAMARVDAVVQELTGAGFPAPPTANRRVMPLLHDNDRRTLIAFGSNPDDFDEVIFVEV